MNQPFESFGKYYLLEKLNQGGMAEVYLSRHLGAEGIGKFVAIKRILPQFSENPDFIEMFKEEAKIAVNLAHSNIVSIQEFGIEKNQFFLVMDYVEGRDLRRILNKMKKSGLSLSVEQVLYIIKEVAAGLDSAHRCLDRTTGKPLNINHRDISPQNVMISFEGEVKIVDFGIAKAETQIETTRAGTLKGKFGYMSPEQAEGQVVDLRTDIFSLGIVLWELLANDRLFVANNEVNTLRKIKECNIPSLRKINPNIPVDLEKIVNKALARDRNLRYQTSAAFHRDLSRFLNRQFPDFSPHDFSVFIKTLFAAEILEHRKKIVEYSKLDPSKAAQATQQPTPTPAPMQMSITTNTPEPVPQSQTAKDSGAFTNPTQIDSNTGGGEGSNSNAYFANSNFEDSNPGQAKKPQPKQQAPEQPPRAKPNPMKVEIPKQTASERPREKSKQEDFQELRFERPQRPNSQVRSETTTGIREGSYHSYNTGKFSTITTIKERNRVAEILQQSVVATLVLFCIAMIGYYAHNPTAAKTIAMQYMQKIGVGKDDASLSNQLAQSSEQPNSANRVKVGITSQPPTAEIWIDGKLEQDVTPTSTELVEGVEYNITVRKTGFVPFQIKRTFKRGEKITAILQRAKIAFVDIVVEGTGEIFVNGKRVAVAGPVLGYQIPADEEVIISAVDPRTQASDEQRIRIGESFSKQVRLQPKAKLPGPARPPANIEN